MTSATLSAPTGSGGFFSGKKRILSAVIKREMRVRFAGRRLGYLWAIFEPMIHISVYVLLFTLIQRSSPINESMVVFFGTGILPWLLFTRTVSRTSAAASSNRALLVYPHIYPIDFMLGRIFIEAVTSFIVIAILLGAAFLFEGFVPQNPLMGLCALLTLSLMGGGLGMINATIISLFSAYDTFFRPLQRLLYFTSGIFFVVSDFPSGVQDKLSWQPILNCVEWLRTAFLPSYDNSHFYSIPYVTLLALALFITGMMLERLRRRTHRIP